MHDVQVVDPQSLSSLSGDKHGMIMLVRPDMLVVGGNAASVQQMNAQLDAGANVFAGTDFGQRITQVYSHGTETVVAANLGQILNSSHAEQQDSNALRNSGFNDIKYLIATRGESASSGQGDNRISLEFTGQRHGIASWLAAPAPMGSLDYVSANARRGHFFCYETARAHVGRHFQHSRRLRSQLQPRAGEGKFGTRFGYPQRFD